MSKIIIYLLNIFDKIYQKKIIKELKNIFDSKINIIFDVGAHKGEFIELISHNFDCKNIYSFEPSEKNFLLLSSNVKKMYLKNNKIHLYNFALGTKKERKIFKQMNESSSSTFNHINMNSKYFKRKNLLLNLGLNSKIFDEVLVKIKDAYSFLEQEKIDFIDLLKIDTEGYELYVIKGFGEKIKKIKVIFFEHHYDNMIVKNYLFSDINNYLLKNNFKKILKFKMPFRKSFEYVYINKNV